MNRKSIFSLILGLVTVFTLAISLKTVSVSASTEYTVTLKPNYFNEELWDLEDELYKPVISPNNVTVKQGDNDYSSNIVTIAVKTPNDTDYNVISTEYSGFETYGEYYVKYYVLSGSTVVSNVVERKITVIDSVAPNFHTYDTSEIVGAIKLQNSTETLKNFKALKGTELKIATVYANDSKGNVSDLTDKISVTVRYNGETDDALTSAYASDKFNFKFTPNKVGVYVVEYTVSDGQNKSKLNYVIDVRENWLEIVNNLSINSEVNSGTTIKVDKVKVVDYYGVEQQCTVKAVLYKGNEKISEATSNFAYDLKKSGKYKLILSAENSLEKADDEIYEFTVVDTTSPVFEVSGEIVKEILLGEEITLPTVKISDNNDAVVQYVLKITVDDKIVNFYNNKFTPIKEGEYVVKYTATDIAGNAAEYSFTINVVTDNAFNFTNVILIVVAGVIVVAMVLVLIFVGKRKKPISTSDSNEIVIIENVDEESNEVVMDITVQNEENNGEN